MIIALFSPKFYRIKLLSICIVATVLGGCAAGKMFMAGYQPPQTIADLLNEQYALAGEVSPYGIKGRRDPSADIKKRSNKSISLDSYDGPLANNQLESASEVNSRIALQHIPIQRFSPRFTYKSVKDYAGQLAMELIKNANGLTNEARIGVTSFVTLDYTLQNTTVLGNQLAEYSISEIQQFGLNVVDFKLMRAIEVTNRGDLSFSRDVRDLAQQNVMDHVLSATMIEKHDGVFINARIIALGTNRVVSSASILVPSFVSQQGVPQYANYYSE